MNMFKDHVTITINMHSKYVARSCTRRKTEHKKAL